MRQTVLFKDLGKNRSYKEIWDLQERMLQENVRLKSQKSDEAVLSNESAAHREHTTGSLQLNPITHLRTENHLLFVEHEAVYTLGKSGDIGHVLIDDKDRE